MTVVPTRALGSQACAPPRRAWAACGKLLGLPDARVHAICCADPKRGHAWQAMHACDRVRCLRSISKVSFYNASEYDEAGSLATIRRALDLGITMLDTAEVYGGEEHENETWIGA